MVISFNACYDNYNVSKMQFLERSFFNHGTWQISTGHPCDAFKGSTTGKRLDPPPHFGNARIDPATFSVVLPNRQVRVDRGELANMNSLMASPISLWACCSTQNEQVWGVFCTVTRVVPSHWMSTYCSSNGKALLQRCNTLCNRMIRGGCVLHSTHNICLFQTTN